MIPELPDTFILFDTEYTAWEKSHARHWSDPGEHRELVQIGALRVDNTTLREVDHFLAYVRPQINPQLSEFLISLTGITQETIDTQGTDLATALNAFHAWCTDLPLYSFGRDGIVVRENCALIGIPCPFPETQFHNIRALFKQYGIEESQYNSSTITEAFGVPATRRGHDALNDVRTTLDGLVCLSGRVQHLD